MKYEYMHPRDEIALTLERIYNYKMTTTSGGNLSIKDENGDIWITPEGGVTRYRPRDRTPPSIRVTDVVVDRRQRTVEGSLCRGGTDCPGIDSNSRRHGGS